MSDADRPNVRQLLREREERLKRNEFHPLILDLFKEQRAEEWMPESAEEFDVAFAAGLRYAEAEIARKDELIEERWAEIRTLRQELRSAAERVARLESLTMLNLLNTVRRVVEDTGAARCDGFESKQCSHPPCRLARDLYEFDRS